ncbi:ElaB/YqjD/DUF883 family membrane-anchored ribosome-binding protein [Massilia sp. UYP11]|uniref:hypothetical protein n=1 Tax=Massilia sp. UYP11 TaxID=1756385 RepID=UPI003D1E97F5
MGLFGKRLNLDSLKNAASAAKDKLESAKDTLQDSASGWNAKAGEAGSKIAQMAAEVTSNAADAVREFDYEGARQHAHSAASGLRESAGEMVGKAADTVRNFDLDESREAAVSFAKESANKFHHYIRSTFEVDKSTFEMVNDIRNKLPVPAQSMEDIYEQCRNEAVRRAIAAFVLGNILDDKSQAKYDKLTDSYDTFRTSRQDLVGDKHENYGALKPNRNTPDGTVFENGYNPDAPLVYEKSRGTKVSVDHVTSKNEIFQSMLLKAGLTDKELGDVMNDPRNLVYANRNLNSQKSNLDVYDWLDKFGKPHPTDPNKVIVTIKGSGEEHVVDKRAIDQAYADSKQAYRDGQIEAVKGIAGSMAVTGATMAAQQVVGLIVVETIDVFMDELKKVKLVSSAGMIDEFRDSKDRIAARLSERFEERQIWAKAKALGMEAGVSGALSVIPQILISLILKMPAFIYSIIRESTLSIVRCVRVLASDEPDKLAALQVIMLGTASAVAGVYVQRVISQGIASVPLLNKFNPQVSAILSGMFITAIPLAAIYTFEQNKHLLVLKLKGAQREEMPQAV